MNALATAQITGRPATADPVVCYCHNVRRSEIERIVDIYGMEAAMGEVQRSTKASTGCGGCFKRILREITGEPADYGPCSFCDNCRCIRKLCNCCPG